VTPPIPCELAISNLSSLVGAIDVLATESESPHTPDATVAATTSTTHDDDADSGTSQAAASHKPGINVALRSRLREPLTDDELVDLAPDVVIMCAGTELLFRSSTMTHSWREDLQSLPAVGRMRRCPRIFTIDKALVSHAGPRLVEGIEMVASLLHPRIFTREDKDASSLPSTGSSQGHRDVAASSPAASIVESHVNAVVPKNRCAHTMVGLNATALLVGGEYTEGDGLSDGAPATRHDDVWRLRVEGRAAMWDKISLDSQETSGFQARSHHTTAMWGERLLVWGGWSATGEPVSADMQLFDMKTKHWVQDLGMRGQPPTPRAHACMAVRLGGSSPKAVVYGGWDGTKRYTPRCASIP
jgi:hypothetical protein